MFGHTWIPHTNDLSELSLCISNWTKVFTVTDHHTWYGHINYIKAYFQKRFGQNFIFSLFLCLPSPMTHFSNKIEMLVSTFLSQRLHKWRTHIKKKLENLLHQIKYTMFFFFVSKYYQKSRVKWILQKKYLQMKSHSCHFAGEYSLNIISAIAQLVRWATVSIWISMKKYSALLIQSHFSKENIAQMGLFRFTE